jgi:hypothetical protein
VLKRSRTPRSLLVWALFSVLCVATTTAPGRTQSLAARRVYLVAPMKATDDWSPFISKLDDYQESMPDAEFRPSKKTFLEQDCDGDPNCDVVTIEKTTERRYGFKIKNGKRSHQQKYACSTCEPNTPTEQCMPGAETDFAGFIIQHNRCHQDQARCNENPCSQ